MYVTNNKFNIIYRNIIIIIITIKDFVFKDGMDKKFEIQILKWHF